MTPDQKSTRVLRVVAVSPGDLTDERDALRAVIDELNRDIAPARGCRLSLCGGRPTRVLVCIWRDHKG
jgi:hypothetical protein